MFNRLLCAHAKSILSAEVQQTSSALKQASPPRRSERQRMRIRASASQASDSSTGNAGHTATAYAALAGVLAASSAARLAAPSRYLQLANSACPDATLQALVRLTGATLIPVVAALWCLKVRPQAAAFDMDFRHGFPCLVQPRAAF